MPNFLVKLIGLLLIVATVGVVSCQALAAPGPDVAAAPSALPAPRG